MCSSDLIPYPVTVGFTAGIAVIIFASQIKDLFGLTLSGKEPGELVAKLDALTGAFGTYNPTAIALAALTIGLIVGLKRLRPHWPGMLIAVVLTALATGLLGLPVETIGTRAGEQFGTPHLTTIDLDNNPNITDITVLGNLPELSQIGRAHV